MDGQDKLKSGKEVCPREVSFRKMRLEENENKSYEYKNRGMERGCIEYYGIWETKIKKELKHYFEVI